VITSRGGPDTGAARGEDRGYRVHGWVQGVGFRWSACGVAERLGVVGSVRNVPNGSVELMARGSAEALARFEGFLRRGPPLARVDRVETIGCTLPGVVVGFSIER